MNDNKFASLQSLKLKFYCLHWSFLPNMCINQCYQIWGFVVNLATFHVKLWPITFKNGQKLFKTGSKPGINRFRTWFKKQFWKFGYFLLTFLATLALNLLLFFNVDIKLEHTWWLSLLYEKYSTSNLIRSFFRSGSTMGTFMS